MTLQARRRAARLAPPPVTHAAPPSAPVAPAAAAAPAPDVVILNGYDGRIQGLRREYDLESLPDLVAPFLLDIGANRGNFVRYARMRWPGLRAHAFEPHPATYAMLRGASDLSDIAATQAAVTHPARGKVRLFEGVNGDHECSTRDDVIWGPDASNPKPHVSQQLDKWVDVDTVDAASLPSCNVLKVDTEGAEIEILSGYRHLHDVQVLLTEAHAVRGDLRGQAAKIRAIAEAAGLRWVGPDDCIQRFVR